MKFSPLVLTLLLVLGACGNQVQTTSGTAYREARLDVAPKTDIDRAVLEVASVEPVLQFPARIGLARVEYGRLVPVPSREADSWLEFAGNHPEYGTYVPISPLVAELAAGSIGANGVDTHNVVNEIRLGAARQHVDAVLIYTVAVSHEDHASPLSLLDLTVVGAYLVPSRSLRGEAVATATLIDVRNGYPYGTASTTAAETGFVPSVGSGDRASGLADDAAAGAVGKLTAEVDTMMARLRATLPVPPPAPAKAPAPRRLRTASAG